MSSIASACSYGIRSLRYSHEARAERLSMNSIAVGTTRARVMIVGTMRMALSASRKRTSRSTTRVGRGISLRMIFVTMPSVPSEPTIRPTMS